MKNLGWIVLLFVSLGCDALSFEGGLFPTENNARNCVIHPSACGPDQICDPVRKTCVSGSGTCATAGSCIFENAAFCNAGLCVGCNALDASATEGDKRCDDWSTLRGGNQRLCIGGACKECRSNADCRQSGKTFCNQANNHCVGCVRDADCSAAGSMICRTDESMLGTGEPLSKIGECVEGKDVAYVKNLMASCSDTAADSGTIVHPYCQIQTAIAKEKSYVRVLSGGLDYDPIQINANSQRVVIYGPGKENAKIRSVTVGNGASLTLQDIAINETQGLTAVRCDTGALLSLRRILIMGLGVTHGVVGDRCARVTIERTKIDQMRGHGIWITGGSSHRVVNTTIIRSGSAGFRAALRLGQGGENSVFSFNTIANNVDGVFCEENQLITNSIVQNSLGALVTGCNLDRVVTMGAMIPDVTMTGADPRITGDSMTMPIVVDKGIQLPAPLAPVTEDYFGNPRPAGGGLDVGFHEYR